VCMRKLRTYDSWCRLGVCFCYAWCMPELRTCVCRSYARVYAEAMHVCMLELRTTYAEATHDLCFCYAGATDVCMLELCRGYAEAMHVCMLKLRMVYAWCMLLLC
jgi:hypothetical protein